MPKKQMEMQLQDTKLSEKPESLVPKFNNIFELMESLQAGENVLHAKQVFNFELSKLPDKDWVVKDDRGFWTIPIDIVESLLDAYFMGDWSTSEFKTQVIANEIVGTILLTCKNPVTGSIITRTGAASKQIMVDSLSRDARREMTKRDINAHYLDINNKKPNSLELNFPTLEAMCLKSAAKKLGNRFGRNMNRNVKGVASEASVIKRNQILQALEKQYNHDEQE